jgi:hypothetical protein
LSSTEDAVAPIIARVQAGRLTGKEESAFRLAKVLNKFKMEKHFITEISDERLVVVRDEDSIKIEAALDGICVLRTTIGSDELDAVGVISAYMDLAGIERDVRSMKVIDVELRLVHHRLGGSRAGTRLHLHALHLSQLPPPPQPRPFDLHRHRAADTRRPGRPRFGLQGSKKEGRGEEEC